MVRPNKAQQCLFAVVDHKQPFGERGERGERGDWRDPAGSQWHLFDNLTTGKLKVAPWVTEVLKDQRLVTEATSIRTRLSLMSISGAPNPQVLTPAITPPRTSPPTPDAHLSSRWQISGGR